MFCNEKGLKIILDACNKDINEDKWLKRALCGEREEYERWIWIIWKEIQEIVNFLLI